MSSKGVKSALAMSRCGECGRLVRSVGEGYEEGVCAICSPFPRVHKAVGGIAENPATVQEKKITKVVKKKVAKVVKRPKKK